MKTAKGFRLRCQTRRIWLAHLLVEIPRGFELWRNLLNSTAIIDHSNMLKPYMEVLILLVLHVPPEIYATEMA